MKFLSTVILLVMTGLTVVTPQSRENAAEREEYSVYSALVSEQFVRDNTRLVIITDPTCCHLSQLTKENPDVLQQLAPVSQDTVRDFADRNREEKHLRREFTLAVAYRIVDYAKIEKLFAPMILDEEWKTFYRLYPRSNGYLRLSRVGFNKDRNEALVETAWMRGERYGEGKYFLLSKVGGKWRVQRSAGTWMA